MKGLDIFVVRVAPFILFGLFITNLLCSYLGFDCRDAYYLHCNSVIYATCLFLISLANKKYHCVYNRAMYIFLIIIPIINYINAKVGIFPTKEMYSIFIVLSTILTIIATAYLAIKHFVTISKRKLKNGSN